MEFIKGSTKRGQNLIYSAGRYAGRTLRDVYGRYSRNKENAYNNCRRTCSEMGGKDFHISSACSHFFTVTWKCVVEYTNPKTGEVTMENATYIDTGRNVYIVLEDM